MPWPTVRSLGFRKSASTRGCSCTERNCDSDDSSGGPGCLDQFLESRAARTVPRSDCSVNAVRQIGASPTRDRRSERQCEQLLPCIGCRAALANRNRTPLAESRCGPSPERFCVRRRVCAWSSRRRASKGTEPGSRRIGSRSVSRSNLGEHGKPCQTQVVPNGWGLSQLEQFGSSLGGDGELPREEVGRHFQPSRLDVRGRVQRTLSSSLACRVDRHEARRLPGIAMPQVAREQGIGVDRARPFGDAVHCTAGDHHVRRLSLLDPVF